MAEPWYEPFAAWHGGMSFHGAVTGVFRLALLWAKINKVAFWNLLDCMARVVPIGLFLVASRTYQRRIGGPPGRSAVGRHLPT